MKQYWVLACNKVDDMTLREQVILFFTAAFVVIAIFNMLLLNPLAVRKNALSAKLALQQGKINELQIQIGNITQAKRNEAHSPLRIHLEQLNGQLREQQAYLQKLANRLVEPKKMAALLEQVLAKNGKLQLISLKTLPVSLLVDKDVEGKNVLGAQLLFKHGVQLVVRGSYADMLQYMEALEKLPTQLIWGMAALNVEKYPDAMLTLTLYTLSQEKTWLAL